MSNLVEILITAKDLTGPAMASVNEKANGASKGMATLNKTAMLAGAAFVALGVESVKMATKFDAEMTLLNTQAGVSKDKIGGLKAGVLSLAGKVGQDPDSLAEALFHVESNFSSMGISSKKALEITQVAAEGATVGQADLVDVTNALTAAVASGIPGVQNMDQAMGVLNATVGSGDMKMQDLAKAFSSGLLATVKGFGLSIIDVGAALATFGDNNIRGANAATMLRVSVQSLAHPVAGGLATLRELGLQADSLAKDMQKGGLKLALEDLVAHMKAAGISADEQGQIITDAFGKKAGSGINILVGQLDRVESKYPEIIKGSKNFSQSWADTTKTFAFQMRSLETGLEALAIGIGNKLIPPLQATIGFLKDHRAATIGAVEATGGLLAAVVAVGAAMKVVAASKLIWSGISAGATLAAGAMETAALKMMYMRDASIAAGGGVRGLGAAFGTMSKTVKAGLGVAVVVGLVYAVDKLYASAKESRVSVDDLARSLEHAASGGKLASPVIDDLRKALAGQVKDTDASASALDKIGYSLAHFGAKWSSSASSAKAAANDYRDLGKAIGSIAQTQSVDEATKALAMLSKQGIHIPTKYLKDYNTALADTAVQSDITAASQGQFGAQAVQVQQDLKAQQDVADGLAQSLQALDKVYQEAFNSETRMYDAIAAGTDAIKANGHTLDINSAAGRKNRDAVAAIAAATDASTTAALANGESQDKVNQLYKLGFNAMVKDEMQMGLNRRQAEAYTASLLRVPKVTKVDVDDKGLTTKLAKDLDLLRTATRAKKVAIYADISDLVRKITAAKELMISLHGKTVEVNVVTTHTSTGTVDHEGGGYAHGGVIGAAGGGPRSRMTLVGEQGPELVSLAPGSTVHSNPDTRRMLAGGGGGESRVVLEVHSGGTQLDDLLVDLLRRSIRKRGGDVQVVLGRG